MNVRELIEELEAFGDHLPVIIEVTDDRGGERVYPEIEVDTDSSAGEVRVILAVED